MIHSRSLARSPSIIQVYTCRSSSSKSPMNEIPSTTPLYLNPHVWTGLPADQVFELHRKRKEYLGSNYAPSNDERSAILSTISSLVRNKPSLSYVFGIENFKEKYSSAVPMNERGRAPKKSNVLVLNKGDTPAKTKRIENLYRVSAYELPLLAKYRETYVPKSESPLKLSYYSDFSEDVNNKYNRKVKLTVQIDDLQLSPKQQHKFKLLAGNKFNHETNKFTFKYDNFPEAAQNSRFVVETFNKLLTQSKDLTDDFSDIPLDTRHMKPFIKRVEPQFPEAWKRPEDAPIAKHAIVERLVENLKKHKDDAYFKHITP
ncbi:37S ribosomal protein S24 mitochondrial [Spathaspora sp. JA1]|nr:37S ribosomal protein S24 mitochondrial [Spathaspora sp. JA1]